MYEEMTNEIDAVMIATPDHLHFPTAMSAMELGKLGDCCCHKLDAPYWALDLGVTESVEAIVFYSVPDHSSVAEESVLTWKFGAIGDTCCNEVV